MRHFSLHPLQRLQSEVSFHTNILLRQRRLQFSTPWLGNEQMGKLIRCLYMHVRGTLETTKVKIDIHSALKLLITQIKIDKKKYENRIEKAKKAAAARWDKAKKNAQAMPKHSQAMHNDNGNVNDNVNDNGNVNVNVDVNDNVNVNENAAAEAALEIIDGKEPSTPATTA